MKNTKIEWCTSTWNPVTGCQHGCGYCYAKKIATRFAADELDRIHFGDKSKLKGLHVLEQKVQWHCEDGKFRSCAYPYGFEPTFHRYRLDDPAQWKKPQDIFVCSMADLFGEWVPDEWIREVIEACDRAPQHRYLFLTKNPKRYEKICEDYTPSNMWFGWTQTMPTATRFETHHFTNTFMSIEPLLGSFEGTYFHGINWVIIGAETGSRKNKIVPEKYWIDYILKKCDRNGTPVFMKDSLIPIVGEENMRRDFPWKGDRR